MHGIEDAELLRRYARTQEQDAFAELVRRHLDFVYAAALRRLDGRNDIAADVAQQAFVALARHAKALENHPSLAGWLYATRRNLAAATLRSDRARKLREEAHAMHESITNADTDPAWAEVRPHLDELIEQLDDVGRDAVVRRFFSNQKFAEMGAALHISEDAARMRVERALERLHMLLRRRGVMSTTAALGTLLTALPAGAAAPAGLAASVSTAVAGLAPMVAATTVVAAFNFMNSTKALVITCGLAALVITGGVYLIRHGNAADAPALIGSETAVASRAGSTPASATIHAKADAGTPTAGRADPAPTASGEQMKLETAAALLEPTTSDRALKIAAIMQKLSRENFKGIRQAFFDEKNLHGRSHGPEWELMTRRAGEIMGKEAVEFLLAEDLRAKNYLGATKQALTGWAAKDPAGALDWLSRKQVTMCANKSWERPSGG